MAEVFPFASMATEGMTIPLEHIAILPEAVEQAADAGFQLKNEFHLTLASSQYMSRLTLKQGELFQRLVKSEPRPELDYSNVLYRVAKPKIVDGEVVEREALVAPVFSLQVERMLGNIAAQLEIASPEPFLHVTLFTRPDNAHAARGIGIDSREAWEALRPDMPFTLGWQGA